MRPFPPSLVSRLPVLLLRKNSLVEVVALNFLFLRYFSCSSS